MRDRLRFRFVSNVHHEHDVTIWNRTRAKAEPLAAKGGKIVDKLSELASCDVVFSIVSEGKDLEQVYFGKDGVLSGGKAPKVCVDCSTISVEESADIRKRLKEKGADYVCAPVSGNAKVIKAGRLSSVVSGDEAACKSIMIVTGSNCVGSKFIFLYKSGLTVSGAGCAASNV